MEIICRGCGVCIFDPSNWVGDDGRVHCPGCTCTFDSALCGAPVSPEEIEEEDRE